MPGTTNSRRQPIRMIAHQDGRFSDNGHDPLESLERRLADGYERIEIARAQGHDVTAWEEFWVQLLHQYERAVDDFPEAA